MTTQFKSNNETLEINQKYSHRYMYIENILKHFWDRWRKEYVTELGEHHKIKGKPAVNNTCNVNDVVLIHEDKVPWAKFKVGVIEEFNESRDGVKRIANVRHINDGKTMHILRPINRLYHLKLRIKMLTN